LERLRTRLRDLDQRASVEYAGFERGSIDHFKEEKILHQIRSDLELGEWESVLQHPVGAI
jgi:hypothetical protein